MESDSPLPTTLFADLSSAEIVPSVRVVIIVGNCSVSTVDAVKVVVGVVVDVVVEGDNLRVVGVVVSVVVGVVGSAVGGIVAVTVVGNTTSGQSS